MRVDFRIIGTDPTSATKRRATFIALFLVVAHVEMSFAMLDHGRGAAD